MRWTLAVFALVLAALQLEYWFGETRRPGVLSLQQQVREQSAANQELIERNDRLAAEILNLKESNEAAEERARSELGLIDPSEDYFQIAE